MEYVNLSIYIWNISKKVSGPQKFYGPGQGLAKLKKRKIFRPQNYEKLGHNKLFTPCAPIEAHGVQSWGHLDFQSEIYCFEGATYCFEGAIDCFEGATSKRC